MDFVSLMARRVLFVKLGKRANSYGNARIRLSANTVVVYNHGIDYLQQLNDWAQTHDGKVVVPFGCVHAVKAIESCKKFVYALTDGRAFVGDIVEAGDHWTTNLNTSVYSAPPDIISDDEGAPRWVKLDNAHIHEDLSIQGWMVDDWDGDRQLTLAERLSWAGAASVVAFLPSDKVMKEL